MSTTGFDIQKWDRCYVLADECGLKVQTSGDFFEITHKNSGLTCGKIHTLDEVFSYLCGYTAGQSKTVYKRKI